MCSKDMLRTSDLSLANAKSVGLEGVTGENVKRRGCLVSWGPGKSCSGHDKRIPHVVLNPTLFRPIPPQYEETAHCGRSAHMYFVFRETTDIQESVLNP